MVNMISQAQVSPEWHDWIQADDQVAGRGGMGTWKASAVKRNPNFDYSAHLVGDEGRGEGDGVLARGDKGMWPTDFRREGECRFFVFMCS